jgi:hypothetical protein
MSKQYHEMSHNFPQWLKSVPGEKTILQGVMYFGSIVTLLLLTLHESHGKVNRVPSVECDDEDLIEGSIHNYTLPDLWEIQNVTLSDYRGKVREQVILFTSICT